MVDMLKEMSGAQRAAIFLLGIGETAAATIMKHMDAREVQKVGEAMASLSNVGNEQFAAVAEAFTHQVREVNASGIGTEEFTRRVMIEALGENKARSLLNKVLNKSSSKGVEALKWMDAREVAELLRTEHPQIIAIILSSLDSEHAAQILMLLPDSMRTDLIMRIAKLDLIDSAAMQELDHILERQIGRAEKSLPPSSVKGMNIAANILNMLDSSAETEIMESLKSIDENLSEKIHDLMFVFEDLLKIDDRGMQRLLRDISMDTLVIALKGVDSRVVEKFFKNMSSRASEMLREDMETKGPVKLVDVEFAQKEILATASKLADEGELMLSTGSGGDTVV